MRPGIVICSAFLLLGPGIAAALELDLPGRAAMTGRQDAGSGTHALATGPWIDGQVEHLAATGHLIRQSWRFEHSGQNSGQIIAFLAEQLRDAGYRILFSCAQDQCGGFDFRFATLGIGEPDMHVDLGDFHYLIAEKKNTGRDSSFVSLLVSRSPGAGFVEITQVSPPTPDETPETGVTITSTKISPNGSATLPDGTPLSEQLEQQGYSVLSDLEFETGSSALGPGPFKSLEHLAGFLSDHPDRRVVLVGHTDAEGSLENNIALSRRRASSVRARLMEGYDVSARQLDAQGVGYLSPVASNLTDEGRTKNRRVEVVLTTTR